MAVQIPTVDEVRQQLDSLAEPLRQQLAQLDAALVERRKEVAALLDLRAEVTRALKAVDPAYLAETKAHKNGGARRPSDAKKYLSDEREQTILGYMREHAEQTPAGFKAVHIAEALGYSATSVSTGMAQMRDQGLLRLDRWEKGPRGGKFYKLTDA